MREALSDLLNKSLLIIDTDFLNEMNLISIEFPLEHMAQEETRNLQEFLQVLS